MPTQTRRGGKYVDSNPPEPVEIDENVTIHQLEKSESTQQSEVKKSIQKSEESEPIRKPKRNKSSQKSDENKPNTNVKRTLKQSWDDKLQALKIFKAIHGHTKVPKSECDKQLGRFVNNLRQLYRKRMNNENNSLTDDRIKALEEIGFVWVINSRVSDNRAKNLQTQWEQRLKEMKEFKKIHGHCNVGLRGEDRVLGKFVMNQRYYYKTRLVGEKNSLTPERIQDLENIGFVWTLKGRRDDEDGKFLSNEEKWERNVEELKQFKERFGHVNVSKTAEYMELGQFVGNQRYFYRRRMKGEKTSLTNERMKTLTDLGFEWKALTRNENHAVSRVDISSKSKGNSQVVEKERGIYLPDGSTIDYVTKETSQKRLVVLEDGSQVLETTTKTYATKNEKSVLPPKYAEYTEMSSDTKTPALSGDLNVSSSENKVEYPDGSSVVCTTEESCKKSLTELPDKSQLLETTTTTCVTKIERSRLPDETIQEMPSDAEPLDDA